MADETSRAARVRTTAFAVWTAIGVIVLIAVGGWIIGRIAAALAPFIIAGIIAFLLHAPVNWLELRGTPRGWAVILCFVVALVVLIIAGIFLFPPIAKQVQEFSLAVPDYLAQAQRILDELQRQYSAVVIPDWIRNIVSTAASDIGTFMTRIAESAGSIILAAGTGVVAGLLDIFLALVLAFWLLKDLPTIRRELENLAGPRFEDDAEILVSTVDRVVGGYLKGQTIASFVTGTMATIGLALIGVPYALVLGIFTFFLNYIPYAGPLMAAIIAGTVGLFVSPLTALLAVGVIIAAQNLTDSLVTPKVMSRQVNLHPTLVIFSLLVGATLWGIVGMIFAIPLAALVQGLFVYYYERRTRRQLSSESGALFKSQCPPEDEPCDDDADSPADDASPGE